MGGDGVQGAIQTYWAALKEDLRKRKSYDGRSNTPTSSSKSDDCVITQQLQ